MNPACPSGARVVGDKMRRRRVVDATRAFAAHCQADPLSCPTEESYLTACQFDQTFREHVEANQTTKGFDGPHWSPNLWIDVDSADALNDTRRLVEQSLQTFREFDEDDLLYFFSGKKGFHVLVPLTNVPRATSRSRDVARRLAVSLAADGEIAIDESVYGRNWLLRAPNSRHPSTGLHKVRLTYRELMRLPLDRVRELARQPVPFEPDYPTVVPAALASMWNEAEAAVEHIARCQPNQTPTDDGRLQLATLNFFREPIPEGQPQTRLYRAAANLTEHGAPPSLVHKLLTEFALDNGLPPSEVRRTIECGIQSRFNSEVMSHE